MKAKEEIGMLILSRRVGESVRVGNDIIITVIRLQTGQVSVGIDAPKNVPVHRQEVYDRIKRKRRSRFVSTINVPVEALFVRSD